MQMQAQEQVQARTPTVPGYTFIPSGEYIHISEIEQIAYQEIVSNEISELMVLSEDKEIQEMGQRFPIRALWFMALYALEDDATMSTIKLRMGPGLEAIRTYMKLFSK